MQHFSTYDLWTTCGPRGLPLWSFKKDRRKTKIQMNCISHYSWKSQSLEITHGNHLSIFSQYWYFIKFITLPIYRLHILLTATKEGFQALWTLYFSPYFSATAVGQAVACMPVKQRAWFDPRSGQVSWVRFFLTCKTNVRKLYAPKVSEYHLAIIIIHNHSLRAPMIWDVEAP